MLLKEEKEKGILGVFKLIIVKNAVEVL